MGVLIFLLIVAVIVVLVVLATKHKHKKAIEELKNSNIYVLALKIKEELEKKGADDFGREPYLFFGDGCAKGMIRGDITDHINSDYKYEIGIDFSEYRRGLDYARGNFTYRKIKEISDGYRRYGIESENVSIMVTSEISVKTCTNEESQRVSQNAQEFLKIAAEVIKNTGNGSCTMIEN